MKGPLPFNRVGYHYLPTRNLDQSIDWYKNNLGLILVNKFIDRGSMMAVLHYPHKHAIATVLIETSDGEPLTLVRNGKQFPVLSLCCSDIDYTHSKLKEIGIHVEDIVTLGQGEAKYFYFRDLDGNYLEASWSIWDLKDEVKNEFLEG